MKPKETKAYCAVDFAFQRIGGKYRGRILWYLHENNVLRYGELKRLLKGITTKMLTQTLRELEQDKMVNRKVYLEVPPKVEYTLTPATEELIPFIKNIRDWADRRIAEEPVNAEKMEC
ncbi:DNA-binding HxlR family transcriptional regulator [Pedobacter sp. W3I1]|uniref:winged helix-turn-helix transcriptional regulator n=1 Tax=Pedobacter sp. W3I1 TaxID=3042291 RepID=UPI0027845774|nr:helix-turn-helix domain-containing protein [Pedobacter sp. W3I1]MDQ0639828.1 DNA-binding HxlR family transcriptional regulator [Pedobacter sp. W3I1]